MANKAYTTAQSEPIRRVGLLEGHKVGLQAMLSILLHESGDLSRARTTADDLVHNLLTACRKLPSSECDVLYGRSGALQAIMFLRKAMSEPSFASDAVLELARAIVEEGTACAMKYPQYQFPLLWTWHDTIYLGAAHGVVGVLSTLLAVSSEEWQYLNQELQLHDLVRGYIRRLDAYCWPSGNLDSSISANHSVDRLVQWCHGAPGHVLLLIKAAEVYKDESFLVRAKEICTQVIWPRGLLRKGVGLCHGIAGNAYATLLLSKYDPSYLEKAKSFASFAEQHLQTLEGLPDHPYSLYGGLAGLCALFIDLADPSQASFPLYY